MLRTQYELASDEELSDLMRTHSDEAAFTELYARYVRPLTQSAYRKTGSASAAEDLVQELFVRFWLNRRQLSIQKTVRVYLFSALKNRVISHYHERAAHPALRIEELRNEEPAERASSVPIGLLQADYERSLQKLPERCQQVFLLSRSGYSQKEIAAQLQISEKTVEAHIGKALRLLRSEFKDYVVLAFLLVSAC